MIDVVRPVRKVLNRVRGEFLEMPGLRLTEIQAQRFFGLDGTECREVLQLLLGSGFLRRAPDGGLYRARA